MFVANGIINGAGHTFITTLTTFVSIWGVRVPIAAYLAHHTHRIEGIWYGMVMGFAAGMITSLAYYLSGRWKRPISGRIPIAESLAISGAPLPETMID
jgi:Na+-driven multidrug efflux pump